MGAWGHADADSLMIPHLSSVCTSLSILSKLMIVVIILTRRVLQTLLATATVAVETTVAIPLNTVISVASRHLCYY